MPDTAPRPDGATTDDLNRLVARVTEQQQRLVLSRFDNDDAWRLGSLLVDLARSRGLAITVDVRRHGQQLFHAALPGTTPDNDSWIDRKVRAVNRFGAPSYLLGLRARLKGSTFALDTGLSEQEYAGHGGCFPLTIRDVGIVGTVTVSGLPQADDHELVVEALETFLTLGSGTSRGERP